MALMARNVITEITDDLDGSKDAREVRFSFDGVDYSIDLSKKNRTAFEKALSAYTAAATKVPSRGGSKNRSSAKSARRDLTPIREWAKQQGLKVSDRGRVSQAVVDQYDASH